MAGRDRSTRASTRINTRASDKRQPSRPIVHRNTLSERALVGRTRAADAALYISGSSSSPERNWPPFPVNSKGQENSLPIGKSAKTIPISPTTLPPPKWPPKKPSPLLHRASQAPSPHPGRLPRTPRQMRDILACAHARRGTTSKEEKASGPKPPGPRVGIRRASRAPMGTETSATREEESLPRVGVVGTRVAGPVFPNKATEVV
ncbi:hypothetical protein B0J18DRAFT_152310 [Chaetomium sp. MPI-SDFR-AT-0129]|nr:hypothetical protein B0J18DRAFT_152310 [Chaetomium sp. MPI-SDFR-AT-0129]